MTKLGRIILGIALGILLILALVFFWPSSEAPKDGVLRIGFIGPIRDRLSVVGEPILQGAEMAVEELKASGRKVELVSVDDGCDAERAGVQLQQLIEVEQVRFVIGGMCNDEALALAKVAEQQKVALIVPMVPSASISTAGDYVFRTTQPDFQGAEQLAEYASINYKKMVVVSTATEEPIAYKNAFNEIFVKNGGVIVDDEGYQATTDIKEQVKRIKNVKPAADSILLNLRDQEVAKKYLNEMKAQGVKLPVFGYPTVGALAKETAYKVQLSGIVYAEPPHLDLERAQAKTFMDAYTEKYGKDGVDVYNAAAYEAVMLYAQGFAEGAVTGQKMREYLKGVRAYEGVQGVYGFDANGDMVGVPYLLKRVKNGIVENVK